MQPTPISVMNDELRKRLAKGPMNGVDSLGIPDSVRSDYYSLSPARRARVLEQFDEMKRNPGMPWGAPLGGSGPLSQAEVNQITTPEQAAAAIVRPSTPLPQPQPAAPISQAKTNQQPTPAQAAEVIVRPSIPLTPPKLVNGIPLPDAPVAPAIDPDTAAQLSKAFPLNPAAVTEAIIPATDAAPAVAEAATGAASGAGEWLKPAGNIAAKAGEMIAKTGSVNPAGIAQAAAEGAAGGPGGMMASLGMVLLANLLGKKQGAPVAPDPLQDGPLPEVWTPAPRPGIDWRTV